jgi:2-dehydro-3-deoxyphosphogluconate aldolase/(4S)-4-hydroxy-2-oxoglutarate aldolase
MTRQETIHLLGRARVIAILRGDFRDSGEAVADALVEGGLRAIEVSLTSPDAVSVIRRLARHLDGQALIGAGTVRKPEDCRRVADAGARFAISPHTSPTLIAEAHAADLFSIPGALTPTEIVAALDGGADAVKLFPADWVGPAGLAALRAPLPGVRFVPTGGVTLDRAREYLARGAWAVGVGSPLMGSEGSAAGGSRALTERARAFAQAAAEAPAFAAE